MYIGRSHTDFYNLNKNEIQKSHTFESQHENQSIFDKYNQFSHIKATNSNNLFLNESPRKWEEKRDFDINERNKPSKNYLYQDSNKLQDENRNSYNPFYDNSYENNKAVTRQKAQNIIQQVNTRIRDKPLNPYSYSTELKITKNTVNFQSELNEATPENETKKLISKSLALPTNNDKEDFLKFFDNNDRRRRNAEQEYRKYVQEYVEKERSNSKKSKGSSGKKQQELPVDPVKKNEVRNSYKAQYIKKLEEELNSAADVIHNKFSKNKL